MKSITQAFIIFEDKARRYFESFPFLQALLAGIGVIIFWRGIWEWLDRAQVSPEASVILGIFILSLVGVFVQTFIGNTIIIKEVKQEELLEKKTIRTIKVEEDTETITLAKLSAKIDALSEKLDR